MRFCPLIFLVSCPFVLAQADPFKEMDTNGDGKLSVDEIPEQFRPMFPLADRNSDHFLSPAELQEFAANAGKPAANDGGGLELLGDVDYVGSGNPRQNLDLVVHKDRAAKKRPLVVYVHGGGWEMGRKEDGTDAIRAIAAKEDYVTATINYRFSQEAIWPAQIHDCKAAIRFLRGKADEYGIDPEKIGVMGFSAGGQLAGMLGTCEDAAMEGKLGAYASVSSRVQCVVNFFGPTDFLTFFGKDVPIETIRRQRGSLKVLGSTDEEIRENARTASPVTWITKDDAPFFTAHGTKDTLVPYSQAVELDGALRKAGVETHLVTMEGAGHGFFNTDLNERIRVFFSRHLKGTAGEISTAPIPVN